MASNGLAIDLSPSQERFTFPSSGLSVTIQRISTQRTTDYRAALRRREPPPSPPVQQVDMGGEMVATPNPSDPEYTAELANYEANMAKREFEWFIAQTLKYDADVVSAYRAKCLEADGTDYAEHPDW